MSRRCLDKNHDGGPVRWEADADVDANANEDEDVDADSDSDSDDDPFSSDRAIDYSTYWPGYRNDEIPEAPLSPVSRALIDEFLGYIGTCVGEALRLHVKSSFEETLRWVESRYDPAKGDFARFARSLLKARWKEVKANYPPSRRRREIADDRSRRLASSGNDAHLAAYLSAWAKRIDSLLGGPKSRWHVHAMTPEEIRDELIVRLLGEVRQAASANPVRRPCQAHEEPGKEATLRFLSKTKDELRRGRSAFVAPDGFNPAVLYGSGGTPEDRLISADVQAKREALLRNVRSRLTKPTQKWFEAAFQAAGDDGFEGINWAKLAASRGKDRATATRARDQIREVLETLGANEFV